jgi:hypothetical protein
MQIKKDAVQEIVNQAFTQQHTKKQLLLLRLVVKLVASRAVEVRFVVEFMLNNLVYSDQMLSNNLLANAVSQNCMLNSTSSNSELQRTIQSVSKQPTSPYLWYKVMECIRKCIPMHDYKACRDIFKMLLELVKRIPHSSSSYPPPLESERPLDQFESPIKARSDLKVGLFSSRSTQNLAHHKLTAEDDIKLESLYEVCPEFMHFCCSNISIIYPQYRQ